MKKIYLIILLVSTGVFNFELTGEAQTKPEKNQSDQGKNRLKIVVQKVGESTGLPYDTGILRLLVNREDTNGAWSLVELTETPGYKTPLLRHNHWDESLYVLEGVLTAKIADKIYELPAGSYILIPRGTPHGQANFGKVSVKLLMTMTPSGFERYLKDRVELFKTVKPGDPEFQKRFDELRKKNAEFIEILGTW